MRPAALCVGIEVAVVERGRVGDWRIPGRSGNGIVLAYILEPAPAAPQRCLAIAENIPGEPETWPERDLRSFVQTFRKTVLTAYERAVGGVACAGHVLADQRRRSERAGDRVARHAPAAGIERGHIQHRNFRGIEQPGIEGRHRVVDFAYGRHVVKAHAQIQSETAS